MRRTREDPISLFTWKTQIPQLLALLHGAHECGPRDTHHDWQLWERRVRSKPLPLGRKSEHRVLACWPLQSSPRRMTRPLRERSILTDLRFLTIRLRFLLEDASGNCLLNEVQMNRVESCRRMVVHERSSLILLEPGRFQTRVERSSTSVRVLLLKGMMKVTMIYLAHMRARRVLSVRIVLRLLSSLSFFPSSCFSSCRHSFFHMTMNLLHIYCWVLNHYQSRLV